MSAKRLGHSNGKCLATSPDGTRCDRPAGHWGKHSGEIKVTGNARTNEWTWGGEPAGDNG